MSEDLVRTPEIEAREKLILGSAPRISQMTDDELTDDALEFTGRMRQMGSRRPTPTDKSEIPAILRMMFRNIELYKLQIDTGIQLTVNGSLPPHDFELAILRVAWLNQAPFEWGEHLQKGKSRFGVTDAEIAAILVGSTDPSWSKHDRAIVRAVEELREDSFISDETWATLAETYDERQMIELPILIGQYTMLAYLQNSLRLPLQGTNKGLGMR
jgi:alkylhydroperoxidase family enzyme